MSQVKSTFQKKHMCSFRLRLSRTCVPVYVNVVLPRSAAFKTVLKQQSTLLNMISYFFAKKPAVIHRTFYSRNFYQKKRQNKILLQSGFLRVCSVREHSVFEFNNSKVKKTYSYSDLSDRHLLYMTTLTFLKAEGLCKQIQFRDRDSDGVLLLLHQTIIAFKLSFICWNLSVDSI